MIAYPKIETLYVRNAGDSYDASAGVGKGKVIPWRIRLREFESVKVWHVSEKVDGTNIRIGLHGGDLDIRGRTDNAQIPGRLLAWIQAHIEATKLASMLDTENFMLCGEGYGGKIQHSGKYADHEQVVLFDVWIDGWWLDWDNIKNIAEQLGLRVVPAYGVRVTKEGTDFPRDKAALRDWLPAQCLTGEPEGIVVRSVPQLFTRKGDRVMWKLKFKDFER